MKAIITNRKTGSTNTLKIKDSSLNKLKNLTSSIVTSGSKYFLTVIAETEEDIEFITMNFHNIPLPAVPCSQAIWTGDLAVFIILNYPIG